MKFEVVEFLHTESGKRFFGIVDDVWYKSHGYFETEEAAKQKIREMKEHEDND